MKVQLLACSLLFTVCLSASAQLGDAKPGAAAAAESTAAQAQATQSRDDAKKEVLKLDPPAPALSAEGLIKTADWAIASAAADVETVKWIFIAFTGFGTVVTVLGGVMIWFGFNSVSALRKTLADVADEESSKLADLASTMSRMMTLETFLTSSIKKMIETRRAITKLDREIADLDKEPIKDLAKRAEREATRETESATFEAFREQTRVDLEEIKGLDKDRIKLSGKEPRWTAWIEANEGLYFLSTPNPDRAYGCFSRAIHATTGTDLSAKNRRASHLYNASCAKIAGNKKAEALATLTKCLELQPRYANDVMTDDQWSEVKSDPEVVEIILKYRKKIDDGKADDGAAEPAV